MSRSFDYVDILSILVPPMNNVQFSIKAAARRSGLTPHVIRVWERRYKAVEPVRTGTNRRLYSDAEVERLTLLREAIAAGHRIGNIAQVPTEQLRTLAAQNGTAPDPKPRFQAIRERKGARFVDECLNAVQRMDASALEGVLTQALVALGHQGLLRQVVGPLAIVLGDLWQEGMLTAAQEHFASAALRVFLFNSARPFAQGESAPCLVVATPAGQLHELGSVMISSTATNVGWRVAYLGVSLPAAEIAGAAYQKQARAVALSIVYPVDDPELPNELIRLRSLLPTGVHLIVGGRAACAYGQTLTGMGASLMTDLGQFCELLDQIRSTKEVPGHASIQA
jgi:MerR family transcriptional regulator, light-induced transcriptional regulator